MTDFEIVLSGPLANELSDDTVIEFWRISNDPVKPTRFKLEQLPKKLAFDEFANSSWNVSFLDAGDTTIALFTVELSRDLFDKPRRINITLDPPEPKLRPFMNDWRKMRFTANISERMHYRDLPYWNQSGELTSVSKNAPTINVVDTQTGLPVWDNEMTDGCWGSRWFARLPDDLYLTDKQELHYRVDYDSGGTFGSISAEFFFKFNALRHR